MTIEEIKEIRATVLPTEQEYFDAHSVEMVDTLLAEVERLENYITTWRMDYTKMELEQDKLTIATEALERIAKQEPSTHHGLGGWDVCIQCDGDIDAARTALERIKE